MHRLKIIGLLLLIALLRPGTAFAAPSKIGGDACRAKVNFEMSRELRLYRAMLFGKQLAKHAPINDVRYDKDGMAWIKTKKDGLAWSNLDSVNGGLTWSDSTMDANDEHKDFMPIKGIFETKRTTTSELIPYLLQSIRAFDCRLEVICSTARSSIYKDGESPVDIDDIQPLGCINFSGLKSYAECHITETRDFGDTLTYCNNTTQQLRTREIALLKLVVEYDAGYRSLLQFAGNLDLFLREMRWPLAGTVRQAAEIIGKLGRIPCFLSSCDIAPDPKPPAQSSSQYSYPSTGQ